MAGRSSSIRAPRWREPVRCSSLLHQYRLLAADIRHPHIGFAALDAEQGQRVEKQLVERLGKPGQRIGDRALDDGLRQADTETEMVTWMSALVSRLVTVEVSVSLVETFLMVLAETSCAA